MKKPTKPPAKKKAKPAVAPAATVAPDKRKVLLVDDHPMMRAGLAHLINRQADLEVAFEAGNPSEAFQVLGRAKVDILLTDMTMPGRSGLEFIKDVLSLHPELPILVVSMHDEMTYAERVLRAGARGYIMKEAGGEKFVAAIRHILAGNVYASERLALRILGNLSAHAPRGSDSPIARLSDREFEIFQLIGQGRNVRQIADQLHLSTKTVDVHRANIRAKLELKESTELVPYAVRWVEAQASSGQA